MTMVMLVCMDTDFDDSVMLLCVDTGSDGSSDAAGS